MLSGRFGSATFGRRLERESRRPALNERGGTDHRQNHGGRLRRRAKARRAIHDRRGRNDNPNRGQEHPNPTPSAMEPDRTDTSKGEQDQERCGSQKRCPSRPPFTCVVIGDLARVVDTDKSTEPSQDNGRQATDMRTRIVNGSIAVAEADNRLITMSGSPRQTRDRPKAQCATAIGTRAICTQERNPVTGREEGRLVEARKLEPDPGCEYDRRSTEHRARSSKSGREATTPSRDIRHGNPEYEQEE
jgi:hypothetical protein